MDVELLQGHINSLEKLKEEDHFKFLVFVAFDGPDVKEIGWERTLSANNITQILHLYMTENKLSLRAKDGKLYFSKD